MRVIPKHVIRFAASIGERQVEVEIRMRQNRWGGWEATALLHGNDGAPPTTLSRVFRSRDHRLTAGKMIAWVQRRYGGAQPIISREGAGPADGAAPQGR